MAPGPTETELFRANNPPGSEGEARYLAGSADGTFGSAPGNRGGDCVFVVGSRAGSLPDKPCLSTEALFHRQSPLLRASCVAGASGTEYLFDESDEERASSSSTMRPDRENCPDAR